MILRVILENGPAQVLYVDMGIYFRCRDTLVPEQLLNDAQVGPVLQQMSGKAMPQSVR